MAKPRSPELARSGHTAVDPDAPATTAPLEPDVGSVGAQDHLGPVPPGNRPKRGGRHDEDKPDLAAFARRLGIARRRRGESTETDGAARMSDGSARSSDTDTAREAGDAGEGGWTRLRRLPATATSVSRKATSLSLKVTEIMLRRSADTIAELRRRVTGDELDS